MSGATPLWALSATALAARFRAGAADPVEALEACLDRAAAVGPVLNAVVALDAAGARAAAEAAAARHRTGEPVGPLDGVPVTVKDNLFVAGLPATWGSAMFTGHVPAVDDVSVARLRAAGAVIIGKTNTPELSLAGFTDNPVFGSTGNPWDPALTPGGSSGGAVAAVAGGIAPLAVATDAGGSIRRPASHAGAFGLRTSLGAVPRRHGFPALAADLQTVGPMARTVADAAVAFAVMAGTAPPAPRERLDSLSVAAFGTVGEAPVDGEVAAAFERFLACLADLGAEVVPIEAPFDPALVDAAFLDVASAGVARVLEERGERAERATAAIAALGERGRGLSAPAYVKRMDEIHGLRARLADLFATVDLVATPTAAALAWPRSEPFPGTIAGREASPRASAVFTTFANLAGLAAANCPFGLSEDGRPMGMQLVGPVGGDGLVLSAAAAVEVAAPWPGVAPLEA